MASLNEQFAGRLERLGVRIPDVLLPQAGVDLATWSVVACDQYTSDHAYWNEVDAQVGAKPSTLRITLPEIFLEQTGIEDRIHKIHTTMSDYLARNILESKGEALIYVKRSTAHSGTREGILFAMDLECYSYARDSKSLIRATEGTIVDRIPPRLAVRRAAPLELPHIMILIQDPARSLIEGLAASQSTQFEPVYDVELMQHGGHLQGWRISQPQQVEGIIAGLEKLLDQTMVDQHSETPLFFAMGDGNHSLATAKARWEETKQELAAAGQSPAEILAHPARYALAEVVNIHSPGLMFEPIHRVIFTRDVAKLSAALKESDEIASVAPISESALQALLGSTAGQDKAGYYDGQQFWAVTFKPEVKKLPPGLVDELFARFKGTEADARIDFIHGWEDNKKLAAEGAACFFLPVIARESLFSWVQENGPLPRKSFSMGEAEEKRYYMEARRITTG